MELPRIKGAKVHEFSSYGTVIRVQLEEWGGVPESFLSMRCTGSSIQFVTAKLLEPTSPAVAKAVKDLLDHMAMLGYKKVWYPIPFPRPPLEENMATIGFRVEVVNLRLEKSLKDELEQTSEEFELVPVQPGDDFSPVGLFFEATRPKTGPSDWSVDPELPRNLFLHELHFNHWRKFYVWVEHAGEKIGISPIVKGMDMDRQSMVTCTPLLSEKAWEGGLAAELLNFLAQKYKAEEVGKISVSCERSEKKMLDFYSSLGFSEASRFHVMYKPLMKK